jgi:hypothetical protein
MGMDYKLEIPGSQDTVTLGEAISGQDTMLVFVRHLG